MLPSIIPHGNDESHEDNSDTLGKNYVYVIALRLILNE